MFTGIVEAVGVIEKSQKEGRKGDRRLVLRVPVKLLSIKKGQSLAVDGVCLTLVQKSKNTLAFEVIRETCRRSRLGLLKEGDRVNLERPLKVSARFHGHFVQGHVDALAQVKEVKLSSQSRDFLINLPASIKNYVLEKGSIAINGVSLTVGEVKQNSFWVHCIPHTLKETNLSGLLRGSWVNLEADLLLKFTERILRRR